MSSFKIDESVFDKLAVILKKHNLSEIEYKDGDSKIRISAASGACQPMQAVSQAHPVQVAVVQDEKKETKENFHTHEGALKSPMVGTCYLAPEPEAASFVSIGSTVQKGDSILIIEAMKVMNLIKAQKSGKIVHIAVATQDPIEYGQLLVVIE